MSFVALRQYSTLLPSALIGKSGLKNNELFYLIQMNQKKQHTKYAECTKIFQWFDFECMNMFDCSKNFSMCEINLKVDERIQLFILYIFSFLAVTQPIKYSLHKDKTERAYIVIFICWLASIGIGKYSICVCIRSKIIIRNR